MKRLNLLQDRSGTSAIEFAFVGPVFMMLVIGCLYGCLMLYSMASLNYAVEEGARCASVKTSVCSTNDAIVTYAQAAYNGPVTPTFTSTTPACGHAVTGTTNFTLNAGVASWSVPLSATACYP